MEPIEQLQEQLTRMEKLLLSVKSVLTFDEALDYMGISDSYLYKLTANSQIPHSKPTGRRIYFDRAELDKWMMGKPIKTRKQIDVESTAYMLGKVS